MNEFRYETVSYQDLPDRHCFTFSGASLVWYEDTEKGEKRSFHCYKDGNLYRSSCNVANTKQKFYLCDVYGNYVPYSLVMENRELRARVKELSKTIYSSPLPAMII